MTTPTYVVIMGEKNSSGYSDYTSACRTSQGSLMWSAPDVFTGNVEACYEFCTRISAYKNGTRVANKNSNHVRVGPCG